MSVKTDLARLQVMAHSFAERMLRRAFKVGTSTTLAFCLAELFGDFCPTFAEPLAPDDESAVSVLLGLEE